MPETPNSSLNDTPLTMTGDTPVPSVALKQKVEPGQERQVEDVARYRLSEYTLYTLAPIYWMVGVPFDITQEFTKKMDEPISTMKLGLGRQIINVPGWENVLEAMETKWFDQFANFLGQCVFQKSGQLTSVCGDYLELPFALSGQSKIAVFTPRGLLFRFKPGIDPDGKIVLYQTTPDGKGKIGELTDGLMEGLKYAGNNQQA